MVNEGQPTKPRIKYFWESSAAFRSDLYSYVLHYGKTGVPGPARYVGYGLFNLNRRINRPGWAAGTTTPFVLKNTQTLDLAVEIPGETWDDAKAFAMVYLRLLGIVEE